MEENTNTSNANEAVETNMENTEKQPVAIKHKSRISSNGLQILQFVAWLLGIIALVSVIIIAVAPRWTASLLFKQEVVDQLQNIDIFQEVSPHLSILLIIIALLFYFISRLIRTMVRYRKEINDLQDLQKPKK